VIAAALLRAGTHHLNVERLRLAAEAFNTTTFRRRFESSITRQPAQISGPDRRSECASKRMGGRPASSPRPRLGGSIQESQGSGTSVNRRVARRVALLALRVRFLEAALRALCRRPFLARLSHAGAVSVAFPDITQGAEVRVIQADGFKLAVNLAEHRGVAAYFFRRPRPSFVLNYLVQPGDKCIDAGANIGLYTCALAQRVGPHGVVIAIEPHPTASELLRRSVALNDLGDRVRIEELALARDGMGEALLYLYEESELASTVVQSDRHVRVPTMTLDALVSRHGLDRVDFAKIDVERAEEAVLAGAESLLARRAINCIFIELLAHQRAHCRLRTKGYTGFLVLDDPPRLVHADKCPHDCFGDYIFVVPQLLSTVSRLPAAMLG